MVDMNRGLIQAAGATGGHVHRLGDLTDVEITDPAEGDILVFCKDGIWRNVSPTPPQAGPVPE